MTRTKTILGISFAAVFVFSMVLIPAYAGGHLALDKTNIKVKNLEISKVDIKVAVKIPTDGSAGAFGYGIFTDGTNNVLALTTHAGIDDHPSQGGGAGPIFHAHVLDLFLPPVSVDCVGFTAEVDFAGSGANAGFAADYDVKVKGKKITVKDITQSEISEGVESIKTFTLTPIGANLCIDVKTSQP